MFLAVCWVSVLVADVALHSWAVDHRKHNALVHVASYPAHIHPSLPAQLELNLALGVLLKNPIFDEAEAEFQQLATFVTRINMRNALQDEMIPGTSDDQEALMISLKRPIVSVMPSAFDKGAIDALPYAFF